MANGLFEQLVDFTDRDFESWRAALRQRAAVKFPQWTDFNRANIGNLLLELFAHTLDVVSFTQDQQLLETRVVMARQRKSMISIGKGYGFALPGAEDATVDLEFTIADGQPRARDITIPAGTEIQTEDVQNPLSFFTTADAVIPAGSIQVTNVPAENAEAQQDTAVLDGSPDQEYDLAVSPYIDRTSVVDVAGDAYTEVADGLIYHGPTEKVFEVAVDENGRGTLRWGDGTNGFPPTGVATIDYKVGGGNVGNVDPNTIRKLTGAFTDAAGVPVQLLVRNPSDAGGGVDRMSTEEARIAIPASLLTIGQRSITRDDFELNARRVRAVARSLLLTADDNPSLPEYTAYVYIIPVGGGLPSVDLKNEVLNELTVVRPPPVGMVVFVFNPTLKIVSITATVYLEEGFSEPDVRQNIEASLDSFFSLNNADGSPNRQIDFGAHVKSADGTVAAEIPFSDLFNAVRDAAGVRKLDKATFAPAADVSLALEEFPTLGSITLVNGDTSSPF